MSQLRILSARLVLIGLLSLAAAAPQATDQAKPAAISRDVCIIGGGSAGTYAAVRLKQQGKTVALVEAKNTLGGHTETYIDPKTGIPDNIGVVYFEQLQVVRDYFASLAVPLATVIPSSGSALPPKFVDFHTGTSVAYIPPNPQTAFGAYAAQLAKYPYLEAGYFLPNPVPADLLLSFGDFVTKYSLQDLVQTIFEYNQGIGDLLSRTTLYVLNLFGLTTLYSSQAGFYVAASGNNHQLYDAALSYLGSDALLSTRVVSVDRSKASQVKVTVSTSSGLQTITASKLIIAIPQTISNLLNFDLSLNETALFSQWGSSGYYTGLLNNTGLASGQAYFAASNNKPYDLPTLPSMYGIYPSPINGTFNVKYGSQTSLLPDAVVQADILASIQKLKTAGTVNSTTSAKTVPNFLAYSSHNPFELSVSNSTVASGFYAKLYALQGQRNTYYTGAAFSVHNSALLWNYTESYILPPVIAGLSQPEHR